MAMYLHAWLALRVFVLREVQNYLLYASFDNLTKCTIAFLVFISVTFYFWILSKFALKCMIGACGFCLDLL